MNPRPPIILRQRRDFGQTISDSFAFMRQNWKPLLKAIFTICVPPMLLGILCIGAFAYSMFSAATDATFSGVEPSFFPNPASIFGILLCMPCFIFSGVMMEAVVHEYLRAYERGEHVGITTGDLWRRSLSQFWSYFGLLFLGGLATMVGTVLCYLPGIWIATSFGLAPIAHGMERTGAADSLARSFKLVHKKWWMTFLLAVVMFLIMYVIILMFSIPLYLVVFVSMFTGIQDGFRDGLPITSMIIGGIGYLLLIIVSFLLVPWFRSGIALWYFSLVEEFESKGLQDRVGNLEAL